jgi:hypothetical protein
MPYSRGSEGDSTASGEHLGIGGKHQPHLAGRFFLFNGNEQNQIMGGRNTLAFQAWHHVVFVREGENVRVHLRWTSSTRNRRELSSHHSPW